MKIKITMKDPDTCGDAVRDAVNDDVDKLPGLSDDEKEAVVEKRTEAVWEKLSKFVEYGEYITFEFDTDAGTATVLPVE